MKIETKRLMITEFTLDMASAVQENSVDEDNKRFVPDEVWETVEEAEEVLKFLVSQYGTVDGPLVYPIIVKATKENIGYIQLCPIDNGKWEIGYHIAKKYTGKGYATEAVKVKNMQKRRPYLYILIEEMKRLWKIFYLLIKGNIES